MSQEDALPPCDRPSCIKEWEEYFDPRDAPGDRWLHCGVEDCHNFYWGFKSGASCEECGLNACEICYCDREKGQYVDDDYCDGWYCENCNYDRPKSKKEIRKLQLKLIKERQLKKLANK